MVEEGKLLSVVIPVYNVKDYLGKTLDCIIEQTYRTWELILVDDGSDDGSLEIAREYCEKDKRIRLYQRDRLPKGAPSCRNMGLELAKGDYLIYLDSDDVIAPYCFKQRVEYIEANDCDFAVFPMMGFYNKLFDAPGMSYGYKPQGEIICALLARTLPFVVVTNIYKRQVLVDNKIIWDTNLKSYQDSDYNLQAIRSGMTYEISNALPDYFYRLSAQNSICKKLATASNCESQIKFIEKQTSLFGNSRAYKQALKVCAAQIYWNIIRVKDNKEITDKFVNIHLFDNMPFFKWRIRKSSMLARRVSRESAYDLIQLILAPFFYIRFRWCYKKWNKHNIVVYKELTDKYQREYKQ